MPKLDVRMWLAFSWAARSQEKDARLADGVRLGLLSRHDQESPYIIPVCSSLNGDLHQPSLQQPSISFSGNYVRLLADHVKLFCKLVRAEHQQISSSLLMGEGNRMVALGLQ